MPQAHVSRETNATRVLQGGTFLKYGSLSFRSLGGHDARRRHRHSFSREQGAKRGKESRPRGDTIIHQDDRLAL